MNARPARTLVTAALLSAACSDPPVLSIEVTAGLEEGALAIDPAVEQVEIVATGPEGSGIELSASAAPGGEFDLGEVPDNTILSFELTGTTADGEVVARGRSVSVLLGTVEFETGVLPLFIQRLGVFARPPGGIVTPHIHAPAAIYAEQFLVTTGGERALGEDGDGNAAVGERYDFLGLAGASSSNAFPRIAKSMVIIDSAALLIDDEGASSVDLEDGTSTELTAPDGFSFGEVSGGLTIASTPELGLTFVVGATRKENPTNAVMVVDSTGGISFVRFAIARAGAAAVYADGTGLVVVGGSDQAPGVETVAPDGVTVASLPYPADATTGAAAVIAKEQLIAVLGGRMEGETAAPTRVLDLRCVTPDACQATPVEAAALPALASFGRAFATANGILVTGESDDGETLAFRVKLEAASDAVEPLLLRDPRRGATAAPAPNGTLAIIGGELLSGAPAHAIEMFFPE